MRGLGTLNNENIQNIIIVIIGIQPLGRSGRTPEFSQATGMALVCCILGKFSGVACHCFPPHKNIFFDKYFGVFKS